MLTQDTAERIAKLEDTVEALTRTVSVYRRLCVGGALIVVLVAVAGAQTASPHAQTLGLAERLARLEQFFTEEGYLTVEEAHIGTGTSKGVYKGNQIDLFNDEKHAKCSVAATGMTLYTDHGGKLASRVVIGSGLKKNAAGMYLYSPGGKQRLRILAHTDRSASGDHANSVVFSLRDTEGRATYWFGGWADGAPFGFDPR